MNPQGGLRAEASAVRLGDAESSWRFMSCTLHGTPDKKKQAHSPVWCLVCFSRKETKTKATHHSLVLFLLGGSPKKDTHTHAHVDP